MASERSRCAGPFVCSLVVVLVGGVGPVDAAAVDVCGVGSCISTGSALISAYAFGCAGGSLWWKMMSGHSAGGVPAVVTPLVM